MSTLTPTQQQVLALLASGSTVTAAAKQAGVHRNTVGNWRRACAEFQQTFAVAKEEQEQHWREEVQSLGDLAISNLRSILNCGPFSSALRGTGANVCMRTAIAVLDRINKPASVSSAARNQSVSPAQLSPQPVQLFAPLPTDPQPAAEPVAQIPPGAQPNESSKSDQFCTTDPDPDDDLTAAERAEQDAFDAAQAEEQAEIYALEAQIAKAFEERAQRRNPVRQDSQQTGQPVPIAAHRLDAREGIAPESS